MLYNYGITPLFEDHFKERCDDIAWQVKNNVITMPLFIMILVPEGKPVWDKATKYARLYRKYSEALKKQKVECGILIQASLGHGYNITENPFQKVVNLTDGGGQFVCCPEDEAFLEHFSNVLKILAREHPAVIMLDDDFRLMMRPGKGCACPLHMKKFNDTTGLNFTREQLWAHLSKDEDDEISAIYERQQNESLVNAAKRFRAAIDSIDPTIQGINCTSGYICEASYLTNPIFAGNGHPTTVRLPNGIYAPFAVREFSDLMQRTAICAAKLKKRGIDRILAETDTIPFNRYAKSARYEHAQYTAAVLEGCVGAKHWLTRTSAFEPKSGIAYRKILAEHNKFYEALIPIAKEIRWIGINHYFTEQNKFNFAKNRPKAAFITKNIERMGLPFYFSEASSAATFLEDSVVTEMTNEQIENVFTGSVFMTARAAADVIDRGYGDLLGVKIEEYTGETVLSESFTGTLEQRCTKQNNLKNIKIVNDKVETLSYNVRPDDGKAKILSPAVTLYKRDNGKLSVVYCGEPDAEFTYVEGFSFLNETRKEQFISLWKKAGALPVYCEGDDEICFRAGYLGDTLVTAAYPLGIDIADSLELYLEKKPTKIQMLISDGTRKEVSFTDRGNNIYGIDVRVEPMYPIILFID